MLDSSVTQWHAERLAKNANPIIPPYLPASNARRCRRIIKFSHTRCRALGPELTPVYRQSAHRCHPAGGRLPLLSARPAVTFPADERHRP